MAGQIGFYGAPGATEWSHSSEVHVTGKRDDKFLDIMISNPVARGEKRSKGGNQMALANIRQRFELAYGTRATVDVEADGSNYAVRLRFPHEVAA